MKRLRKWMLVSACATLGAVSLYYVTLLVLSLVLSHIDWATFLGLKRFDWVSQDAAVDYTVLGFMMGVSMTLGAAGGVLVGRRLDHRLVSTSGPAPNCQKS